MGEFGKSAKLTKAREVPYPYNLMPLIEGRQMEHYEMTASALREMVDGALMGRDRQVIEMRYRDMMTLAEVGDALGLTRERVRQIEARAIHRLSNAGLQQQYAAVPYRTWWAEREARLKAEQRLDWFLQNAEYRVTASSVDEINSTEVMLEDMDLSTRTHNCLKRREINSLADILKMSESDLIRIRWFGVGCMRELVDKVHALGYRMSWEGDGAE